MITDSMYDCPVCQGAHKSLYRLVGMNVLACDKLTPVGEVRMFPGRSIIAVGAGLGVDQMPEKVASVYDLQGRLAELERRREARKAEVAGPSAAELQAQIDQLEKELQA